MSYQRIEPVSTAPPKFGTDYPDRRFWGDFDPGEHAPIDTLGCQTLTLKAIKIIKYYESKIKEGATPP